MQQQGIVFGVRELPRRDRLKPSVMFLTPWLIWWARAAHGPIENNARRGPRSPVQQGRVGGGRAET